MADKKKITIVGAGYVGMSLSLLLAQKNQIYVHDIEEFKARSDLIVTNRKSSELDDVESKLFTRDIFGEN